MKGKPGVPPTLVRKEKPEVIKFNLSMLVGNYYIAKRIIAMAERDREKVVKDWTSGLLRGYDDWFDQISLKQDKFNEVLSKLDRGMLEESVKKTYDHLKRSEHPLIILPGISPSEVRRIIQEVKERANSN